MISFDEAVELVRLTAKPVGTEIVPLAAASQRVLASPVVARVDAPRRDVSAMDGYAVREADLSELPARLRLVGESFAGAGWNGAICAGECVRIFTGAPMPEGSDRVIIQERVERDGDHAVIAEVSGSGKHVRPRGGDFTVGDELLPAGRILDPRAIVAAAAADVAEVVVHRRPLLRILATGDELAEPGSAAAGSYLIPESVSFGVAALAAQWGAESGERCRLGDDLKVMERAAAEAVAHSDLVVVTGGASVGEKDFAKAMFASAGLELIFSKISIKPGKPVWLGRAGQTLVMGLPGNPTSALATARLLLAPLLARMAGRDVEAALQWRQALLTADLPACGPRETFHRARLADGKAEILSNQDSSAQKALAAADLLVRQRASAPAQSAGTPIEVLDF